MDSKFVIILILSLLFIIVVSYRIIHYIVNNKYKKFVLLNSMAIKELEIINEKYIFEYIPNHDMSNSYDNEFYYNNISPKDYLTYQLIYEGSKIQDTIKKSSKNGQIYLDYKDEIDKKCQLNNFGNQKLLKNKKKILETEKNMVWSRIKNPTTNFSVKVKLILTNINGRYKESKSTIFYQKEISDLLFMVRQKKGDFYLDDRVWDSITKVERGKVTNRMRFAIYERDNWRCCHCGRKTNDLEIDHIIPISKGGKSTFDNLQTLCRSCNYNKGAKLE